MPTDRLPTAEFAPRARFHLALACVVLTGALAHAQSPETGTDRESPPAESAADEILFDRTIDKGVVFLNGEYVPRPYHVEATADAVIVNGRILAVAKFSGRSGQSGGPPGMDEAPQGLWDRGSEGRRSSETRGDAPSQHPAGPARSMTRWTARQAADLLDAGATVILFDELPVRHMFTSDELDILYETLLAETPTPEQEHEFVSLSRWKPAEERWRVWLANFTPDPESRTLMEAALRHRDEVIAAYERQWDASQRLETLAYPLTIAGMLLSIVAFGHLLQWMGKGLARDDEHAPLAAKHVVVSLWLMLGMSVIDLTWTILAGQAGVMREVNPLAARFIDTPMQLALFKVLATLVGFGILFAWRRRYQIQQATWWLCLACVLVTFRWVIFDTMVN